MSGELAERQEVFGILGALEREGKLTRTQLDLTDTDLSYDQYESIGRFLGALRDTSAWAMGDWLIYGEGTYGDKYAQAVEATGRSKGVLTDWLRVAMFVNPARRRPDLTWSHHRLVVKCSPREQRSWLTKAATRGWSVEELKGAMQTDTAADYGTNRESPPLVEDVRSVIRLLLRHGSPDGNGYVLVPVDVWARLQAVGGEGQ